jgi:phage virion morphogenesis protein
MSVKITKKLSGISLDEGIERLIQNVASAKVALLEIAEDWLESTKDRFKDETGPDGKRWVKNAPITKARKRNPKILQEKGERGGLLGTLNYSVSNNMVSLGSPSPHARIHQLGGKAGRGRKVKIPARPYLGVSKADAENFQEIISDHILSL